MLQVKIGITEEEISVRRFSLLALLTFLLSITVGLYAQNFSINAEVDRDQVGFGESLNFVLTITRKLNTGVSHRINIPAITTIPGFDIASTRSAQSTRYINGDGETESQILYELVPQQSGKVTIPAFSFKDPEGNEYSTKAIEITVMPPQAEDEKPAEVVTPPPAKNAPSNSLFRGILVLGLILGSVVAVPFVLFAFFNRKENTAKTPSENQPDVAVNTRYTAPVKKSASNDIEDAVIASEQERLKTVPRRQINFADAVNTLKREHPDADSDFYRRYFALFREAVLSRCATLSDDMTSDEIFKSICELAAGDTVSQAARRLANDVDMVMYANRAPARPFASIDADAREIVKAITD